MLNYIYMKVKALKNIIFGTLAFKEGETYEEEKTKGINPAYFERFGETFEDDKPNPEVIEVVESMSVLRRKKIMKEEKKTKKTKK